MGAAAERLMATIDQADRFDHPPEALLADQVAALDERFQERRGAIKLLAHRADEAGIERVTTLADMVPLLFPHTAYKSYPESFLTGAKWDRLIKWLGTVDTHPIPPIDVAAITDIDDWVAALERHGHYISCSSGTTGKSAMLPASDADMAWSRQETVSAIAWGTGVEPRHDRRMMGLAPVAAVPKNRVVGDAQEGAYCDPARPRFGYPVPPLTVGALTRMVALRKAMAEGTARPEEIADFERTSAERQQVMDSAVGIAANAMIEHRHEKLYVAGMWNSLYQVAVAVRERGFSGADFDPDNMIYVGGGLKRARLPDDYQQFVHETFNIPADRHFQIYSMQELNSVMPKCRGGGRYHVPPWIVPFILNQEGDALVRHDGAGEVTGRAGFFDLSLDGRWGGVITGDKVSLSYEPCACGQRGATIADTIARYADIQGDDKIGCAGTVDAYVRGVA